jgi:tripartite-type tricarboxylate transporter receptor subunit TctC
MATRSASSANTLVTLPYVEKNTRYAPREFTGVAYLSKMPMPMALVVAADSLFKSLPDLDSAAKRLPGSVTSGSVSIGTTSHLPVDPFARESGDQAANDPLQGHSPGNS